MKRTLLFLLALIPTILMAQGVPPRQETKLDQVYNLYDLSGEGTLFVMIDRGIDYRHPDFIDENGNTRLAYIYDMLDPTGAGSNPYGIGTIFDEAQINASLQGGGNPPLSRDRGGHGTSTTGIAVGNGSGTASLEFQGVAPNAKIISIKVTHDPFPAFGGEPGQSGFFDPTYIPVALNFAADKIAELDLPSITLMNLGSIGGPTDGTSLICRAIDDFVALGNTFVCGVGDDGGQDNHAAGTINQGQTIDLEIIKAEPGNLRFDLWYSEDDRFTISIERPNGTIEGPFTAPTGPNESVDQNLGDIFMFHRGANTEFFEATSNRRELLIDLTGATGTYLVRLEGATVSSGNFNATLNPATYFNNNRFNNFVVAGTSINDYASANSNITPGDYVVLSEWTDINGVPRSLSGQGDPGEIWLGNSEGPTHDGRLGIDFVVPGEVCHAAYADNTYYESFSFNVLQNSNGLYGVQNAVSAAAPVASGIMLLMLEVNPNLTPVEMKQLLQDSSREDSFTGTTPNQTFGYGKLDALAAIEATFNSLNTEEFFSDSFGLYPNPTNGVLNLVLPNNFREGTLKVHTMLGQFILSEQHLKSNASISIDLPKTNGIYFVSLQTKEHVITKKVIKH